GEAHPGNPLVSWARSFLSPLAESWIGFTVARRFSLPVPWIKVKGRIAGRVLLQGAGQTSEVVLSEGAGQTGAVVQPEAAGYTSESAPAGLGGIYVRAGLDTVRTDAEGNFRFPPFAPGTYELYLENLP